MTQGFCMGFGMMYALDSVSYKKHCSCAFFPTLPMKFTLVCMQLLPDRSAPKPTRWMRPTLESADRANTTSPVNVAFPTSEATASSTSGATARPKSASIGGFLRSFKLGK